MVDTSGYLLLIKNDGDRIIIIHSIGFWERLVIWLKHPDFSLHRTFIGNKRSLIKYLDRDE